MTATDEINYSWLEMEALELGTENQRERYAAEVLPEDELLALARTELFAPFDDFKRWAGRDRTALTIKHTERHTDVDLETTEVSELGADEWTQLKLIRAAADKAKAHRWLKDTSDAVTVTAMTHWATCRACKAEACRSSAKVTIHWAGRALVREYAL